MAHGSDVYGRAMVGEDGDASLGLCFLDLTQLLVEPFHIPSMCCDMIAHSPSMNLSEVSQTVAYIRGLPWDDAREQSTAQNCEVVGEVEPRSAEEHKSANGGLLLGSSIFCVDA